MEARYEREYERTAAPILPQGHRPVSMEGARDSSCGTDPEQQATQDVGLEDSSGGTERLTKICRVTRCCDDQLNPPTTRCSLSSDACATGSQAKHEPKGQLL